MAASILEIPIDEAKAKELLKEAEADLTFLWRGTKIPIELQARMIKVGFTELNVLAKMANTEEDVEAIIDKEFGFKKDLGFLKRALTAKLLAACEAARLRGAKRRAEEAKQRASDIPHVLPEEGHLQMMRAYDQANQPLKDHQIRGDWLDQDGELE